LTNDFLLRIKDLADSLNSLGDLVSKHEQLDVLIQCFRLDYKSFLSLINNTLNLVSLDGIKSLLVAQEAN